MKTKENSTTRKKLINRLDEIKDLYILQNKKKSEVAKIVECSEATLTRFLQEQNIRKRSEDRYKDYDVYRPIIQEKISLGENVKEICDELNITNGTYHNILGDEKVKRNSNKINESWINEDNPFYWYFLGILFSDGHVDDKNLFVSQSNLAYLNSVQKEIGHYGTVHKVDNNKDNGGYKLIITSSKLREYLAKYNIKSDKRYSITYANPASYINERNFIRGYFDGDGCLYYAYTSGKFTNKNLSITSGSLDLITGVSKFCSEHNIDHAIRERTAVNIYYTLNIEKFEDIIKFGNILYEDTSEFCLKRKYIQFLKFKELVELDKKVNEIVDGSEQSDDL